MRPETRDSLEEARRKQAEIEKNSSKKGILDGFKKLADAFVSFGKDFSGSIEISGQTIRDSEASINALGQLTLGLISGSLNTATALYIQRVSLNFSYIREPSLQTASSSSGEYFNILARSLADKERLDQQYRMMGINAAIAVGITYAPIIGSQIVNNELVKRQLIKLFGNTRAARAVLRSLGVGRIQTTIMYAMGRRVASFLARRLAAAGVRIGAGSVSSLGFLTPFLIAIEAATLAFSSYQLYNEYLDSQRKLELSVSKNIVEFLNPERVLSTYLENAYFLGTSGKSDFSELLSTGLLPSNSQSFSSMAYSSAAFPLGSSGATGNYLKRMGFTTEDILRVGGNLTKNINGSYGEDLASLSASIMETSGFYLGGKTDLMSSIMTDIMRTSNYDQSNVQEATNRFEEFFAAVVGNGTPQAAHINLVKALSSFSYTYGSTVSISLNAPQEIAKIHQFMSKDGSINGRFDTSATEGLITSVDDLLFRGATFQDLGSMQLMRSIGISREDAIKGVTSDAGILETTLRGILRFLRVDSNDVYGKEGETTELFDQRFQSFVFQFGLDRNASQYLYHALQQYASGKRVTDINEASLININREKGERLQLLISDSFSVYEAISESTNLMVNAVDLNMEYIINIQSMLTEYFVQKKEILLEAQVQMADIISSYVTALASKRQSSSAAPSTNVVPSPEAGVVPGPSEPQTSTSSETTAPVVNNPVSITGSSVTQPYVSPETPATTVTSNNINNNNNFTYADTYSDFYQMYSSGRVVTLYNSPIDSLDPRFSEISRTVQSENLKVLMEKSFIELPSNVMETQSYEISPILQYGESSLSTLVPSPTTGSEVTIEARDLSLYNEVYERLSESNRANFDMNFLVRAKEISSSLGIPLEYLLTVIYHESAMTFSPSVRNQSSGATGLIQVIETVAGEMGTTTDALANMTSLQQLDYVEKYFKTPWRRKYIHDNMSLGDFYLIVFSPAYANDPDSTVMYRRGSSAYEYNKALDVNNDGNLTKGEVMAIIRNRYTQLFGDLIESKESGGMVFTNRGNYTPSSPTVSAKKSTRNMRINIPLSSLDFSNDVRKFSNLMSSSIS